MELFVAFVLTYTIGCVLTVVGVVVKNKIAPSQLQLPPHFHSDEEMAAAEAEVEQLLS